MLLIEECLVRWKTGGPSDIREGLDKLPQKVASASDGAENTEDAEPKTPENGDVALSAEVEGSEEAGIDKGTEEKAPLSGVFPIFCALWRHPLPTGVLVCPHVSWCEYSDRMPRSIGCSILVERDLSWQQVQRQLSNDLVQKLPIATELESTVFKKTRV